MLQKRLTTAAIAIPITLGIIVYGGLVFALALFLIYGGALYEWGAMAQKIKQKWVYMLFGFVYMSVAFYCLYILRDNFQLALGLTFLLMIWISDTAGYAVGKNFGKRKMIPRVSPNKTWAGFVGALCAPAILGFVASFFIDLAPHMFVNILFFSMAGIAMGASGQAGDLLVSFVKRKAGVKDSGTLFPGHGGLLDRLDSLFLAAPIFLTILSVF